MRNKPVRTHLIGTAAALAIVLAAMFVMTSDGGAQPAGALMEISDPWVRLSQDGDNTATAYFTLFNTGRETDHLLRVSSSRASRVTLQRLRVRNFRAEYETVGRIPIGAYERLRLRPDDYHAKLHGLTGTLRVGQSVDLTLVFERAGRVNVTAEVSNQLLGNR